MFCRYCGKSIAEDSDFCTYCGKHISDETNSANTLLEENHGNNKANIPSGFFAKHLSLMLWKPLLLNNLQLSPIELLHH